MQNYRRIYDYYYEFWKTIYEVYARHCIAYKTTYYRLDQTNTIWDDDTMFGGGYDYIGELSGIKFTKILFLPVYYVTETTSIWDAQPEGFINASEIDIVLPSDYGFTPLPGDMVKFDEYYIDKERDNNPIFKIAGMQKQTHQNLAYWKMHCDLYQSKSIEDLDLQTTSTLMFYEYDKKIHTLNDSISLTRMLNKNKSIRENLKNLYDQNSGLYFV